MGSPSFDGSTSIGRISSALMTAASACEGQILVSDDMLGLFNDFIPRFVKRYDELGKRVVLSQRNMRRTSAHQRFRQWTYVQAARLN